jgi:hypothetical protein
MDQDALLERIAIMFTGDEEMARFATLMARTLSYEQKLNLCKFFNKKNGDWLLRIDGYETIRRQRRKKTFIKSFFSFYKNASESIFSLFNLVRGNK